MVQREKAVFDTPGNKTQLRPSVFNMPVVVDKHRPTFVGKVPMPASPPFRLQHRREMQAPCTTDDLSLVAAYLDLSCFLQCVLLRAKLVRSTHSVSAAP